MSWVTVIWSMIASACLTLAAIYWMVWYWQPHAWTICSLPRRHLHAAHVRELRRDASRDAGELLAALRWTQFAACLLARSVVRHAVPRRGAAMAGVDRLRPARALPCGRSSAGTSTTSDHQSQRMPFLGDPSRYSQACGSMDVARDDGLMLIFVADASVTAWRRGDRRKALMIGRKCRFFLAGRTRYVRGGPLDGISSADLGLFASAGCGHGHESGSDARVDTRRRNCAQARRDAEAKRA